jgi:hypothetical protein
MAFFRNDKDKAKHRFYLLPGQGGRAHWRKQRRILGWSLFVALVVAGILSALMYWVSSSKLR